VCAIPSECLRYLPRSLDHVAYLFSRCFRLFQFPAARNPQFSHSLRPISLLSTTSKLFEKVTVEIVQRRIQEGNVLNAVQFGFLARHSMILHCILLMDRLTRSFSDADDISTTMIFLDIEKAFDTTWNLSLIYKLSKLEFST
jgi:hypothetical protein